MLIFVHTYFKYLLYGRQIVVDKVFIQHLRKSVESLQRKTILKKLMASGSNQELMFYQRSLCCTGKSTVIFCTMRNCTLVTLTLNINLENFYGMFL